MPPLDLNKPNEGDVGWADDVNQNFTDIETRVNSLGTMALGGPTRPARQLTRTSE